MKKTDFKKELKHLDSPSTKEVVTVDVPVMNFLMIDGAGGPHTSEEYQDAIETLYAMAYALKFAVKTGAEALDYVVMPLEGLWWVDNMTEFSFDDRDAGQGTAMIMQPEPVTHELVDQAIEQVAKKKESPGACQNPV